MPANGCEVRCNLRIEAVSTTPWFVGNVRSGRCWPVGIKTPLCLCKLVCRFVGRRKTSGSRSWNRLSLQWGTADAEVEVSSVSDDARPRVVGLGTDFPYSRGLRTQNFESPLLRTWNRERFSVCRLQRVSISAMRVSPTARIFFRV